MSRSRQPDTSGGLAKLPIDMLLNVFDGCDIADILNLALVSEQNQIQCSDLRSHPSTYPRLARHFRTATEERHVWLTQFRRCCTAFLQAPFRSRTKELRLRSTAQLESWAIQQARTDVLWVQSKDHLEFQSVRIDEPSDIRFSTTILLPGGEYLVVFISNMADKEFVLKKIEWGNDMEYSGWLLTDVARCTLPRSGRVE